MSKSFTSAMLVCSALLCCDQSFGQNAAERADRKVTGEANESPNAVAAPREAQERSADRQAQAGQANQNQVNRNAGYTQHDLAAMLTICNQNEVTISKMGADKAQHADVKKFAEEMVKAHTEMVAKIQQADAAGIAAADGRQAPAADGAVGRRSASVEPSATQDSPIVGLHRELATQCLQSKQEELGKKDGAEFDKCFMGAQLGMHMGAIDTLKVFQRHSSGELRQTIDEGIKTAETHLEHAKSIMKSLETAAK